jgi:hypothetical protein
MARKRTMTDYRDVIRRLQQKQSKREIQRETGIHRTIIRKIEKTSFQNGWLDPAALIPNEEILYDIFEKEKSAPPHPLVAWHEKIKEWISSGHSYVVMHTLISASVNCSEATLRRYIKRHFPRAPKVSMRRDTIPGEVMEVDYGFLGITYDPLTARMRKTYVFSGRLRHSRDAYREIVFGQKQESFFQCHIHAFEYFGGVPAKVVPDNLKAAVIKASFTNPSINRIYQKLAEHYGFLISPCPPYTPQHKGGVENDIKYVKGNFWPLFKERQKMKGFTILRADDLSDELEIWNRDTARVRIVGGVGRSPACLFDEEEKQTLKGLPPTRWEPLSWAPGILVHTSWEIQLDCAFYTVPYAFVGKRVDVLSSAGTVYIFFQHKQIALHRRASRRWEHVKKDEHAPANVTEYLKTTRESIIRWARSIGPAVGQVVTEILNHKSVDGLKPARAVLAFRKTYGEARLEAACRRALAYDIPEYRSIKSILVKGLDKIDPNEPIDSKGQKLFKFTREYGFFDPSHNNSQGEKTWMN